MANHAAALLGNRQLWFNVGGHLKRVDYRLQQASHYVKKRSAVSFGPQKSSVAGVVVICLQFKYGGSPPGLGRGKRSVN